MNTDSISAMREDWDRRAREDASYYVAFGRRGQDREEFFSTATEVLRTLREEFRRFPPDTDFRKLAAIEIGCGPGRLMVPMSETFGRVAGVDVSGEMVRLARENLAGIPHAEVHCCSGVDLSEFEDESFDFCYSYAVFQHIPSADVVWNYLREARRVLKPGGLMKVQLNGLPVPRGDARPEPVRGWSLRAAVPSNLVTPPDNCVPDTWSGARFCPEEVARFAAEENWQLLSMDGFDSQYLWVAARKPAAGEPSPPRQVRRTGIYRVTNTWTEDATAPWSGRFASASLRGLDLPGDSDLNRLRVDVNGVSTAPSFVGKYVQGGPTQVNFYLPPEVRSGVATIRLRLDGESISKEATIRIIDWVAARKPAAGEPSPPRQVRRTGIYRVTNTWTEDATAPRSGRFASASLRGLDLPGDSDLNRLRVDVNGVSTAPSFVGKYVQGGPTQVNFYLPPEVRSGVATIRLRLDGESISEEATIRIIEQGPMVPKLLGISDGINLLSRLSIESRAIRVSLEEVDAAGPEALARAVKAEIDGRPVDRIQAFLVDPLPRRYELNLSVPDDLPPGRHELTMKLARRRFPVTFIEIAP